MIASAPPPPYHVRLAISQYGDQFRAELFTEDLGDTEGDLLTELPPSIAEWVPYLAQGADLPPDAARQLGKDLFAALLGQPENAKKWSEVLAQAGRKGQSIRLLIDATTEAVRDLPYGLLCEPHDDWFLFRHSKQTPIEFVRILRRCSPRPLKLPGRLRVLIAVAQPESPDVPAFDAPHRLQQLAAALHQEIDITVCGPDGPAPLAGIIATPKPTDPSVFAPYTRTTRDGLRKSLAGEFDVFHLLAHGHGAGVLLCKGDNTPAETTAGELAEWCGVGRISLAFLQVCKAGQTGGRGGFGGVAQQLLKPSGGNLSAVVASTFPLDAEHSTDAALDFYRQLAAGKPPEVALTANRPEADLCWAFLELWARPGAIGGTGQRAAFQFVSPYRGLSSFAEQDADLFFGRTAEVAELLQILRSESAVAVVGDSGSGKTSLLQAGLVNAVRRSGLAEQGSWKVISLRPGYRPVQALLGAAQVGGNAGEVLPSDPPTVARLLQTALSVDSQPLLVIFDQFEEVFTLARDPNEVQALTDALAEAVDRDRDRFRLVLGMRSEYLGQAASVRGLSRLIRRPWVLRPPAAADMRDIVAGPAEHCGYTFQGPVSDGNPAHTTALLDRILADPLLARDAGGLSAAPLPLLQFALERLWLTAVEKGVTEFAHAEFDEIGGLGKAIAQHAEAVFQGVPTATGVGPAARSLAEQIITALVSTAGTRQPRGRDALQAETGNPDAARHVVDYLVGERLLTVRSDPEDITKSLLDLSHEALILHWGRLRGWLAEDPQGRAMREEFRTAAEKWEAGFAGVQPRSRYGLPGADVARNYLAWIGSSKPHLSPGQQEFARAMREMLARLRRRRQVVMAALAGLTLAATGSAIYAGIQAEHAKASAAAATTSAEAATTSEKAAHLNEAKAIAEKRTADVRAAKIFLEKGVQMGVENRPSVGVSYILASLNLCPADEPDLRRVILTNLAAWGSELPRLDDLRECGRPVVAIDPAGRYALLQFPTRSDELVNRYQLYDIEARKPAGPEVLTQWTNLDGRTEVHYQPTRASVFADGTAMLSSQTHSSVWDMKTGMQKGKLIRHEHNPGIAVLSPDARTIAVGGLEGHLRLWDVVAGTARGTVVTHPGQQVFAVAFSHDGTLLAIGCGFRETGEYDRKPNLGMVHVYDVGDGNSPLSPRWKKHTLVAATCVEFSPDKSRFVGGGSALHTWRIAPKGNPQDGELLPERLGPEAASRVVFNTKTAGEFIASNPSGLLHVLSHDEEGQRTRSRVGPLGWLPGMGFRSDGRLFTVNSIGLACVWSLPRTTEREFPPPRTPGIRTEGILSVAFDPTGKSFVLGAKNGMVYLFDLANPRAWKEFRCSRHSKAERQPVTNVRFSTSGDRIIARDKNQNVFVFDPAGGPDPLEHAGKLYGVAADGKTALVSLEYNTYQLAEVGSTRPPPGPVMKVETNLDVLQDWSEDVDSLRVARFGLTPDGDVAAIVDSHGAVHLFFTKTGEPVGPPIRQQYYGALDPVRAVAFSPGGDALLTRSSKVFGFWEARTAKFISQGEADVGFHETRFSPSGRYILGETGYNVTQVWNRSGNDVTPELILHRSQVYGLNTDLSETRLVTACADHTARIWDLATALPLSIPFQHPDRVNDVAFSPDGRWVLTGCWDGIARLWPVPEPVADDRVRLTAWVDTITSLRIDLTTMRFITTEQLRESKKRLDDMGGPPVSPR